MGAVLEGEAKVSSEEVRLLEAEDGMTPLWAAGAGIEGSVAELDLAATPVGRGGRKPFRFAADKEDTTDRAVERRPPSSHLRGVGWVGPIGHRGCGSRNTTRGGEGRPR